MAGAAVMTATAVALTTVQPPPPPDITVSAHSVAPALSDDAVALLAAVQRMTTIPSASNPVPTRPTAIAGQALANPAGVGSFAIAPNLANTIDNIYLAVEPWVRYGFEVASYALGWIPYVGIFAGQVMVFYNFGQSIVASGVFNFTDWLRGDGGIGQNLVDFGIDVGLAFVWLGLDELAQWIPLPPIPLPPRPPLQGPFLAAAVQSLDPALAAAGGPIGTAIADASHVLANVSNEIWNAWNPVRDTISYGVALASNALNTVSWIPLVPLANFELNATWDLIASEGNEVAGFAHDMINAGDAWVTTTFQDLRPGLATSNAFWTTVNSVGAHGTAAIDNVVDYGIAQLDYFTGIPFAAATEKRSVSAVPALNAKSMVPLKVVTDTAGAAENLAASVRTNVAERGAAAVASVGTGIARARGEVRSAAGDLTKKLQSAKPDSTKSGSEAAGASGPVKAVRKAANDAKQAAKDTHKAAKSAAGGSSK
jgi:hypothetical protein